MRIHDGSMDDIVGSPQIAGQLYFFHINNWANKLITRQHLFTMATRPSPSSAIYYSSVGSRDYFIASYREGVAIRSSI